MPRHTRWIDALIDVSVGSGAQMTQTLFPGIGPDDLRNSTIVRTITELGMFSTTVGGAQGVQAIDIGLGVISQEAISAGIFPDPNATGDFPVRGWLFRKRCLVGQGVGGEPQLFACEFDIRSQRKLDTGQYFAIINNTGLKGTTFTTRVTGMVRTLVLLP